ncbi:MAG: AraC family transcriptional regulator [Polyangiaceae bacterium]
MDALSRIINAVRLRGSVLSIAELATPFGVFTRGIPDGAIFHAVVEGSARLTLSVGPDARPPFVDLGEGDVVLLARGQGHTIVDEASSSALHISQLPRIDGVVPRLRSLSSKRPTTRIVCGMLRIDRGSSQSLLSLLPAVLHHRARDVDADAAEWVRSSTRMLELELRRNEEGSKAIAGRLCEVLFVQLLRTARLEPKGWLAALSDAQIGQALALIHEDPRSRWDAAILAERVGMSRSGFFARFTDLVGEAPAQYLARWRMSVAADQLVNGDSTLAELAEVSGYASEDAFARVFKRHFGLTPGAYRKSARSAANLS